MPSKLAIGALIPGTSRPRSIAGTAFAISSELALTAFHCVGDRESGSVTVSDVVVRLRKKCEFQAAVEDYNEDLDVALLRLTTPLPQGWEPVPLSKEAGTKKATITIYGFPGGKQRTFGGRVENPDASLFDEVPAIELFSDQAGAGGPVHGLSGAPVIIDRPGDGREGSAGEAAIGIVRWAPLQYDRPDQAEGGTLFASPISLVAAHWPAVGGLLAGTAEAVFEIGEVAGTRHFSVGRKVRFPHTYPLQRNFGGRRTERQRLSQWLRGEGEYADCPVLALLGIGGEGKSSLAWVWAKADVAGHSIPGEVDHLQVAELLRPDRCLEGLLFWSFYEEGGTFQGFLEYAIDYLSDGRRTVDHYVDGQPAGKPHVADYQRLQLDVVELLQGRRVLLVWDGAERLLWEYARQDAPMHKERPLEALSPQARRCADVGVPRFIASLAAQSNSRLLFTSRIPFQDLEHLAGAVELRLTGLDPDDAVQLLRSLGISGSDDDLRDAARAYEFHPMSLRNLAAALLGDFDSETDISAAQRHDPTEDLRQRREHILERAYGRREPHRQQLLSRLAATRGTIQRSVVRLLASDTPGLPIIGLGTDLAVLVKHGLLRHEIGTDSYSFHPIVRRYAYRRLADPAAIHRRLGHHYATASSELDLGRVRNVTELAPLIDHYFHTARSGDYDGAFRLFKSPSGPFELSSGPDLNNLLFHRFSDLGLFIELLLELFPAGSDGLPTLPHYLQGQALNDLALAYGKVGRPRRAVDLLRLALEIHEQRAAVSTYLVERQHSLDQIALSRENLGVQYIELGELESAYSELSDSLKLYRSLGREVGTAVVCQILTELMGYLGQYGAAKVYARQAMDFAKKSQNAQGRAITHLSLGAVALLKRHGPTVRRHAEAALAIVQRLETEGPVEAQWVETQWLLGAAEVLEGKGAAAEPPLREALSRCRRIRLVRLEPRILLERAKAAFLRASQGEGNGDAEALGEDATRLAEEARSLAERCEYRLQEAEAHNVLARVRLAGGDLQGGRRHADLARRLASCGVDPKVGRYYYKPAFEVAVKLSS